jgi:Cu/Ag efflux pump CusA
MNAFTDLFIRRPVLATVVSLLILLIGGVAGLKLQIRQFPQTSNTTITITTSYPGANADVIKGFVTTTCASTPTPTGRCRMRCPRSTRPAACCQRTSTIR